MPNEQDTTLGALQTALKMEIDGKEFYLKASKSSQNELGKQLLKKLAAEEDVHRATFQNIYDVLKVKKGWPDVKYQGDGGRGLRTIFAEALEGMDKNTKSIAAELDAIKVAMDFENKTYDFYKHRSVVAIHSAEKELYDSIAIQESEHHRALLDYYEFLQDPAQWYVKAEHTSVDGG
ncbi:MAG: ferritin family protein [Dehalococcoidales bacterium]